MLEESSDFLMKLRLGVKKFTNSMGKIYRFPFLLFLKIFAVRNFIIYIAEDVSSQNLDTKQDAERSI